MFLGNNMRFFIENKIKCYGSEINQEIENLCKKNLKRLKYKLPVVKIRNNKNLNYGNNYFNMLVSINTIHYSYGEHLNKALSEYSRVIKKGGYTLIETPTQNHYIVKASKKISDFNYQRGLEGFRKNTNNGFVNKLNMFKKMILKYFSSFQINYKNEIYGKYNFSTYFFI